MNNVLQKVDIEVINTLQTEINELRKIIDNVNYGRKKNIFLLSLYSRYLSVGLLKHEYNVRYRKFWRKFLTFKHKLIGRSGSLK